MHAVRMSLGPEYECVRAAVESYAGHTAAVDIEWRDRIQTWAQEFRLREGERLRESA
jgi:hypothetical protein